LVPKRKKQLKIKFNGKEAIWKVDGVKFRTNPGIPIIK
jgi:hypothetical protein